MSIRGFSINITERLSEKQAICFAQWIGAANVIRNQKIIEYRALLSDKRSGEMDQAYSHIKANPDLIFLKEVPVQLLRNAASLVFADKNASQKGLRKFPRIKARHKKRNTLITKELTLVEPHSDGALLTIFDSAKKTRQKLFSIKLPYDPEQLSAQYRISRLGSKFSLSGSFEDGNTPRKNDDILRDFAHLDESELLQKITGIDRGIVRPIQTSDGLVVIYSIEEVNALKRQAKRKARYQRILARKKRLNRNKSKYKCESDAQRKLAAKITQADTKIGDIRVNFCHVASRRVVDSANEIIGLEDLILKNMTKKAKPKRDVSGRKYLKNHARAKSGLNRSLHNVALGRLGDFIEYKAIDQGKATARVNPAYTSQTCHVCGGRNTSRPNQATFICHDGCGTFNADDNASKVVAQRTVVYIKESKFAKKAKARKSTVRRRKKAA